MSLDDFKVGNLERALQQVYLRMDDMLALQQYKEELEALASKP